MLLGAVIGAAVGLSAPAAADSPGYGYGYGYGWNRSAPVVIVVPRGSNMGVSRFGHRGAPSRFDQPQRGVAPHGGILLPGPPPWTPSTSNPGVQYRQNQCVGCW